MKILSHLWCSPALAIALALLSLSQSSATIFTTDTVITPGQLIYENTDVVVSNATLTVDGPHTFASLLVGPGGVVTHSYSPTGNIPTADPVADEPQILTSTNEVLLGNSNITPASVGLTDSSGTTTYQTNADFVLRIEDGDTFLSRSETSAIPDGAMVLVSYQIPGTNVAARLNLTITGNLEVQAGARIDADGRGLNSGTGMGFSGGNPLTGSGGGHGGFGGANSTNTPRGNCYGAIQSPSTLGSRGGTGVGGAGSLGGGAIRLEVSGLAQIDGLITANGLNATNSRSGGGSGGSIWLTAQTLSGAGAIAAQGGNGEPTHGGGGGGGRIAINSTTNDFTGTVAAFGGFGAQRGGAGTIYQTITNIGRPFRSVLLDNGNAGGASSLVSLTDGSDLTISGRAGVDFPTISQTLGDLLVHSNSWIQMAASGPGSITVRSNITLELGAEIRADGRGLAAGQGSGAGHTVNIAQDRSYFGTGAGHGGSGAPAAAGGTGGMTYGSSVFPTSWGSGGGNANVSGTGGAGGGYVRLNVPGELRVDGKISANGLPGLVTRAGGGSGGGVYLNVGKISGTGQIFANGGSGNNGGGNGGGGRIAILFTTNSFTGQITAFGATNASAAPGGAGSIYLKPGAAPGELRYINNGVTPAITSHDQTTATAVLIAGGATLRPTFSTTTVNELMILDHATLLVSNSVTVQVNSNATIAATARISGDAHGSAPNQGSGPGLFYFSANTGNGAGHGGYGGRGSNNPSGGGRIYGTVSNPNTLGSGGGANTQTSSGNSNAGGGALRLVVLGNLHLDGLISVNGGSAISNNFGGGSGGSAYVSATTLSGAGRISADGGAAHAFGGGGGGGRIALLCIATNFTGTYSAKGGAGFSPGGAGTIYLRTNSFTPSLILDNAGQGGTNSALELSSLQTLYIGAGTTVSNFQHSSVTVSNLYLGTNALWQNSGTALTLTVADAATLSPGSGIYLEGVSTSGPGNGSGNFQGYTGAGHGGYGGRGSSTVSFNGGNVYDIAANPNQAGSRGGGNTGSGNNGGGVLRMTVSGPFQLDGRLSVNAANQTTNNAGGGSGGSIWLTLKQFSGRGAVTANGGNGSPGNGGGGGGGRIAVHFFTNTFSGSLQARGGNGFVPGGAGTVYLNQQQFQGSSPDLIVDNGGLVGTNTPLDTLPRYNRVLITGGGRAQIGSAGGILNTTFFQLETNSSVMGNFSLNFTSNAVVAAGASILANGVSTGFPGTGGSFFEGGGGGGHGGIGGRGASVNSGFGGPATDSWSNPTLSGGNGGFSTSGTHGIGGGVVRLSGDTYGSRLTMDGLISADGTGATSNSGGGAGGTVSIAARQFGGSGQITATGGPGAGAGGGGAGGRIAVSVYTNEFTGSYTAKGAAGRMAGGAGTIYQRINSAAFIASTLLLDNGGLRGTNTPVSGSSGDVLDLTVQNGAVADNFTFYPPRNLLVRSNGWIAQTGSFSVSQDLTIEPGGGFDLDGFATTGIGAGVTSFNTKGGGGHGGRGGNNPSEFNGRAYDSITAPNQTGSPGGNGSGTASTTPLGGAGGGAVKVTVARTFTLDGIIRANGKDGDSDSGGGSGGSIWIDTQTLAGNGTITANGGAGNNAAGGGGGGRIAVYSKTNLFTGTMSAVGGAGSIGGGAGTVYTKVAASSNGTLRIGQQELPLVATTPLATAFQFPANANLFISDWAKAEVVSALPNLNTLVVSNQSTLLAPTNGAALRLNVAGDVLVTADSLISAAGRGAPRNQGAWPGGVFNGTGGGGGHGGIGGDSLFGASGGASYGWAAQPTLPGSGGGVDPYQFVESSSGGGVIRLFAGGELRVDGSVNADGQFGWADDSGGGAGGSIWLTTPVLTGTGSINAMGGDGEFFAGGGGGGGRIAIYAPSNSFTGWTSVAGGNGAYSGGIGTIFISTDLYPIESLSGRVTNLLGQPVAGVLLQATGGLTNTMTDFNGLYSLAVTGGWTGTLTPTFATNVFVPSVRSYTDFGPPLAEQNFLMVESEAVLAPTFTWQLLGTNIVIAWPNIPGVTCQLLSSTNLVDWQLVSWGYSTFNGTNHSMSSAPALTTSPQQFFRLRATY